MEKYVNKEISWLSFNARVLQEAMDKNVPLLERLKFLGIYSSNLDEFFSVRIANLKKMITNEISSQQLFGESPKLVLDKVLSKVQKQHHTFDKTLTKVQHQLKDHDIHFIDETQLSQNQQNFVQNYFETKVRSRLIPIMLDNIKKFPYLKNAVIYLLVSMSQTTDPNNSKHALIEVPADVLPRFVLLPTENKQKYVIMLDDVIRYNLKDIFKIFKYDTFAAYTLKLTKDAELDLEDNIRTSMFEKISKSIKSRESGDIVRLIYDKNIPENFLTYILHQTKLTEFQSIVSGNRYHNARDMINFANSGNYPQELQYTPITPLHHPAFQYHSSIFHCIRKQDILLHFPFQSFHSFVDLLREAAIDPKVKSIKMTIYRLADQSDVVNALMNALLNGKSVTVILELQARFDEEANIQWAKKLEKRGANLISSIPGMKVHSKLCLISRRTKGKKERFAVISTGNFNESTAKYYTDHALFTNNPVITKEIKKVFEMLTKSFQIFRFRHLLVSPFYMRNKLSELINNEIKLAKMGKKAEINIKVNNFNDKSMTDRLYRASKEGVKIRMIVRSICSVVPGIVNISENIEIHSIVDKYLEHSRIFWFHNDGADNIYISSADIMVRNLDNRVEVAIPIIDDNIKQELKDYFNMQFYDNQKSRYVNHKEENKYYRKNSKNPVRFQTDFYEYLKKKS